MTRLGRTIVNLALLLGLAAWPVRAMAQEHGQEPAQGESSSQIDISHHLGNSHEFLGRELPRFAPIHIGGLTIDLSPTKHLMFMLVAALLVTLIFVGSARAIARAQAAGRPAKGFAGAMEATALYIC
jgi:F-type H+-transporting ATPase subunit a